MRLKSNYVEFVVVFANCCVVLLGRVHILHNQVRRGSQCVNDDNCMPSRSGGWGLSNKMIISHMNISVQLVFKVMRNKSSKNCFIYNIQSSLIYLIFFALRQYYQHKMPCSQFTFHVILFWWGDGSKSWWYWLLRGLGVKN